MQVRTCADEHREFRVCSGCKAPAELFMRITYSDHRDEDVIEWVACQKCGVRQLDLVHRRREALHLHGWVVARAECRLCRRAFTLSHPYGPDVTGLKCPHCGRRSLDVVGWEAP